MFPFKHLSYKIATIFIAVTVLVVVITGAVFVFVFSDFAFGTKKDNVMNVAEAYATLLSEEDCVYSEGMSFSELPSYTFLADGISDANVWVMKADGYFLTEVPRSRPYSVTELSDGCRGLFQRVMEGEKIITEAFSDEFGNKTVSAMAPVYSREPSYPRKIIAVAVVHSSTAVIRSAAKNARIMTFVACTVAITAAAFIAFFMSRKVTEPIREMSAAAGLLAKGDYNVRIESFSADEMGELAVSLNRLAGNLDNSVTKLQREKDKLSDIINNISDGIASFNADMKMIQYNPALISLCTEGQFNDSRLRDMMMQVLQTGETQTLVIEGKDILRFTATRIADGDTPKGVVVIVRDISQTERLEKLRNEFVSNVSHELRTPLTIIKGSVELLTDGVLETEEEKLPYYKRIETETVALEKLVKDLLDTSKFKAGKIVIEMKRFDINPMLADILPKMKDVAKAKKNVNVVFTGSSLPDIVGDTDRLRQVFIILIDNAIKFTPENGTINFSTRYDEKYAYFTVRDTGIGISEEDLPFVFERFYKVDKSRGGSETGSGLGLSIAWHIAELHHGTIQVESEVGIGTAFTVIIPLATEDSVIDEEDEFPEDYGTAEN